MIRTVTGADILGLLADIRIEAFKLELRDSYAAPGEEAALERWRRGDREVRDAAAEGIDEWIAVVHDRVAAGAAVRRVRVITEPASEYVRFEAAVVPMQQEAGEEFRYLPRDHPVVRDLTDRDFWMFDGRLVLVLNFDADGRPTAHELHDDPETARWYAGVRDTAWPAATPYDEYAPNLQ